MAFVSERPRIPTAIGTIRLVLIDYVGSKIDEMSYEIQVLQDDGTNFKVRGGDLVPHLTEKQIASVRKFVEDVRALAQGLLP